MPSNDSWDVVFQGSDLKEVTLEYKGVPITLKLKELSWSEKNKILTTCFNYKSDGTVAFDLDKYLKESLSKMIVSAPWGETNHLFLTRISPSFGAMLEKLVPKAFEEVAGNPDFFVKEPKAL